MNELQKQNLRVYEQQLNPEEQKLLQVCALFYEPISRTDLLKILRYIKDPSWSKVRRVGDLDPSLRKLQGSRLLDQDLMCIGSMQEIIARKAAQEEDFSKAAACISQGWPAKRSESLGVRIGYNPGRLVRDLRLALLSHDSKSFQQIYELIQEYHGDDLDYAVPILPLLANPFDPAWMQTLPLDIQAMMLTDVLNYGLWTGEEDPEIWAYARSLQPPGHMGQMILDRFVSAVVKRLLLAWDLEGARTAMERISNPLRAQALRSWLLFLQGDPNKAARTFEQVLAELRKRSRSKKVSLQDECGLVYALCLIKLNSRDSWERLQEAVDQALLESNANMLFAPAFLALRGVLRSRELQLAQAREDVQLAQKNSLLSLMARWIIHQASYWVENKLSDLALQQLQAKLQDVQSQRMDWLTLELGALLEKAGKSLLSSSEAEAVGRLRQQSGLTPMADVLQNLEPWQQALQALQQIAETPASAAKGSASSDQRLVWLIQPDRHGSVELHPKLQKKNAKGYWTKGRNVAMNKLYHQSGDMDFLTQEDRRVLSALRRYLVSSSMSWYGFDPQNVLPRLVGHPRLFLYSEPETHVEFVQGEPEIRVVEGPNGYALSMSPNIGERSYQLIRETWTRFKVLQITPEHKRIASILRGSRFSVPQSGFDELVRTVSSLTALVTVHSDIQELAGDTAQVQADCRPCVQITPAGIGFRVEMTVRPLDASGPALKPGAGQTSLMAEVQGQRLQTTRDLEEEARRARAVEQVCSNLGLEENEDQTWTAPDPEVCLELLSKLKELQDENEVQILWPEGKKLEVTRRISLSDLRLSLGSSKQSWFELKGQAEVDEDTVLELKKLLQAASGSRFVPLDESRYAALSRSLRRRLQEIGQLAEPGGKAVKMPSGSALLLEGLEQEVGGFSSDRSWAEHREAIQAARTHDPAVPSTLKAELRDYQVQGFQWLSKMAMMGFGACLADDMGLGKTLQALALIVERAPQGPALVVAPTSVCSNWLAEARRFTPTLEPVLYAGRDREEALAAPGPFQVIICSYGMLLQDSEALTRVEWQTVVLDEAQAIKNWSAKRTQAAMQLEAGFRMVTTGTPLENNLNELWTLFRFLNPGLLGPRKRFQERFAVPIQKHRDEEQRKVLQKIIRPFILRRLKSQVMEELPARTEVTLRVPLSRDEASLYEAVRRQALESLEGSQLEPGQKHLRILAELTRLRQLCSHPRLVFADSRVESSKMALLQEIVSELQSNGHKALIFSQFVKNLHLVRAGLEGMGIAYRYLDGSTPARAREQEIAAFQAGQGDVFLISLKAGGTGINLTAADYVIHLDPWWNPAVEDQAADRTHRIGQERPVTIYRLVAENTVEEKIVQLHAEKRELAEGLLEGSDVSRQVDAEELLQLLRQGRS